MDAIATAPIRKGRKYDQVLHGAREVFMRDGFEGASVDDIARVAGVSKATLYAYFPDKRILFFEVVHSECERQAELAGSRIDESAPPRDVLTTVAWQIVPFLLSDFARRIFRICLAESDRFPELGRAFYESGPALGRARMTGYLREAAARGELRIDDFDLAAEQYSELCKAHVWTRSAFGVQTEFSQAELTRVIDGAVDTFLARYGV
ncbi:TetR/AcrR family transcriptional regulator [Lutimaribacter sp. EGI FJ00015]|uniref:TetR/AcrR family transcriptional regulator n=1 Tax=Lutimaribacter degradans TaxID=2945989 RepID=A0ACC5ZVM2_9RHOB|nr:TetR/AcrR family transcriptional regulator [Lutimaribacter sp. EGI FJ00013]MCM2561816.1 TetR/AcrR family transcriptional regulator [Lutimaribacter sp. EGI FJ00013]MCO0613151.1 TetR/AcrR family transcriptional regulator [Lutimaribacter sp. EGI FJ00015]MCO0635649.1 TetR/AcrR family transcriptional regulator [Lutimaribacter sp. EGI FJ00014]